MSDYLNQLDQAEQQAEQSAQQVDRIADNLRHEISQRGINYAEIGRQIGTARNNISLWMSGKRRYGPDVLRRIAKAIS